MSEPETVQDLPDAELLSLHTAGDERAFDTILRRHRDRMWAVAIRTLGDPEEAAEAVQDASFSAYRAAHRFRGDAAVTTWLYRIVVNACNDRIRRKKNNRSSPSEEDGLEFAAHGRLPGSDPMTPSDVSLDVRAALEQLPEDQRSALVLVDMLGYRVDEAAQILDIPSGTVKSRCARGRLRLLPFLRDSGNQ